MGPRAAEGSPLHDRLTDGRSEGDAPAEAPRRFYALFRDARGDSIGIVPAPAEFPGRYALARENPLGGWEVLTVLPDPGERFRQECIAGLYGAIPAPAFWRELRAAFAAAIPGVSAGVSAGALRATQT